MTLKYSALKVAWPTES